MTLMTRQGHLTNEALQDLAEGSLCEVQRAEIAEHLTLCDTCLLRLTAMDETRLPVQAPPHDLVPPTLRQLQKRRLIIFAQRCGIVAAAACFMLVSWAQGALGRLQQPVQPAAGSSVLQQFSSQLSDSLVDWSDQLSQLLQESFEKTPAAP